jgi:hypothetical protein
VWGRRAFLCWRRLADGSLRLLGHQCIGDGLRLTLIGRPRRFISLFAVGCMSGKRVVDPGRASRRAPCRAGASAGHNQCTQQPAETSRGGGALRCCGRRRLRRICDALYASFVAACLARPRHCFSPKAEDEGDVSIST